MSMTSIDALKKSAVQSAAYDTLLQVTMKYLILVLSFIRQIFFFNLLQRLCIYNFIMIHLFLISNYFRGCCLNLIGK